MTSRIHPPLLTLLLASTVLVPSGCSESRNGAGGVVSISSADAITGSGVLKRETREPGDFTGLELNISADVRVRQSETPSVVIEADDNLLPVISTEVVDGTLVVSPSENYSTRSKITLIVGVPVLRSLSMRGAGDAFLDSVTRDELRLSISGAVTVDGVGSVDWLDAQILGSGRLLLGRLRAKECKVTINGAGRGAVFASEKLTALINGSGRIEYLGDPQDVTRRIVGAGRIRAGESSVGLAGN